MLSEKGPSEKNEFQQKGFNIGDLLHSNWKARKMKGSTRIMISGSSYCAPVQNSRPKNSEVRLQRVSAHTTRRGDCLIVGSLCEGV